MKLIARLLGESGFAVEHLTYANTFLFPIALVKRLAEKVFPPKDGFSDLTLDAGWLNSVLQKILAAEAPLAAGIGLPYGLSVIAVGRKR
jgi:hypothetical protein